MYVGNPEYKLELQGKNHQNKLQKLRIAKVAK